MDHPRGLALSDGHLESREICGYPGAASGYLRGDLWQHGFCGKATALTHGEDGAYYAEQYQYTVRVANAFPRGLHFRTTSAPAFAAGPGRYFTTPEPLRFPESIA